MHAWTHRLSVAACLAIALLSLWNIPQFWSTLSEPAQASDPWGIAARHAGFAAMAAKLGTVKTLGFITAAADPATTEALYYDAAYELAPRFVLLNDNHPSEFIAGSFTTPIDPQAHRTSQRHPGRRGLRRRRSALSPPMTALSFLLALAIGWLMVRCFDPLRNLASGPRWARSLFRISLAIVGGLGFTSLYVSAAAHGGSVAPALVRNGGCRVRRDPGCNPLQRPIRARRIRTRTNWIAIAILAAILIPSGIRVDPDGVGESHPDNGTPGQSGTNTRSSSPRPITGETPLHPCSARRTPNTPCSCPPSWHASG